MLLLDFFSWWYGKGWLERLASLHVNVLHWIDFFSLGTLLRTLFKPWKQIVSSAGPNGGLSDMKNAFLDNLISRFVGFFVRISVLIFAVFVLMGVFVVTAVFVLLWPLLPLFPVILIVWGAGV